MSGEIPGRAEHSPSARASFKLAQTEARELGYTSVGTDLLVLGALQQGRIPDVLRERGLSIEGIREVMLSISPPSPHAIVGEIGLTPGARRIVWDDAPQIAQKNNRNVVTVADLLLANYRDGDVGGFGRALLEKLEITRNVLKGMLAEAGEIEIDGYSLESTLQRLRGFERNPNIPEADRKRVYGIIVSFLDAKENPEADEYSDV